MVSRNCKICETSFDVKTDKTRKVYCCKQCKLIAAKRKLKSKYDANPDEARRKAREAYFRNHDDSKKRARIRVKQARLVNPEVFKRNKLKSTYGISMEDFLGILDSQGNKCTICSRKLSGKVNSKELKGFVDHDHQTGAVRGILCLYCNSIIGYCREQRQVLLSAIEYLEKFKE